jgi:hypothetical protein
MVRTIVGSPPVVKKPVTPSPNNKSVDSVSRRSVSFNDSIETVIDSQPSMTSQNTARRELFSSSRDEDVDPMSLEEIAASLLLKISKMQGDIKEIKNQLIIQTMMTPRENRFLVIAGTSDLFMRIMRTVGGIVQLPFRSVRQINFQTRLIRQYVPYGFLLDIYLSNCTAGGSVFVTCNNVWIKLFSNRLSRKLAWAAIGEAVDYDEENDSKTKPLGKSKQPFHMLRSQNPDLRNLMMRK